MRSELGDIWDRWTVGNLIVIPTNGFINKNGKAVMGKGLAYDAKTKFPTLPISLGASLKAMGNHVFVWKKFGLITFPVKHNWWEIADLNLIEQSAKELASIKFDDKEYPIYIPLVGCGNGELNEKDVIPILQKYLDDKFILIKEYKSMLVIRGNDKI